MRLLLHLGAHKTATTYLQEVLAANRQRLREAGIGYVPLDEVRASLTAQLGRSAFTARAVLAKLTWRHRGCSRLILSDENIPGLCTPVRAGRFYPDIAKRLDRLARATKGREVEIFYATRSYPTFISSMYCEFLRHRPFMTFAEYRDAVDLDGFSWRTIVDRLCDAFGPERVTLWRYEDFPEVEPALLSALCEPSAPPLSKPASVVRESLSAKAVEELGALVPVLGRDEIRARVGPISQRLSKDNGYPPFEAFDASRAAEMDGRYRSDMAAIESAYPEMRVLRPEPVPQARQRSPKARAGADAARSTK